MKEKRYRLIDIARQIDHDKSTIIRWEDLGLIPMAKRDGRGSRYYSWLEVDHIIDLVKKTNYFKNGHPDSKPQVQKMVYI